MKWTEEFIKEKTKKANKQLKSCNICPRECKTNRLEDDKSGICKMGKNVVISSSQPHFGEESPLVGTSGSGTIFFTSCSLRCIFCQNYDISLLKVGTEISVEELAQEMMFLEQRGCHNINLVTPTHFVPQILEALKIANRNGLSIPIVYNSSGYESVKTLKLLEGIIDIYMPDIKFSDCDVAKKVAKAPDYPEVSRKAIKEMHRQVGDLVIRKNGVAVKGLLVRHLVLPNGLAETESAVEFIANEISKDTYINIMGQYYPSYKGTENEDFNRRITSEELNKAFDYAKNAGLWRFDGK